MKKINILSLAAVSTMMLALASGCPGVDPAGEGEGEGEGEEPTCPGGEIDDGACLEDRGDGDLGLCDGTNCVDPNALTGDCDGGAGETFGDGPVITSITEVDTGAIGDPCASYSSYVAFVYSEAPFDDGLNANRLKYINEAGATGLTYSEPGLLPAAEPVAGVAGYYTMDFYLCEPIGDGAIFLTDNDNLQGNVFCMGLAE